MTSLKREEEGEMSIEEILASIRRYVGDEPQNQKEIEASPASKPEANYSNPSHKELNQNAEALAASLSSSHAVSHSESEKKDTNYNSDNIYTMNNAPLENVIRLTEAYAVKSEPYTQEINQEKSQRVLSPEAQTAASHSLSRLADVISHNLKANKKDSRVTSPTLDQLIKDLAQPLIKQWLDQNLPRLVEIIVAKEIEHLTKQLRRE